MFLPIMAANTSFFRSTWKTDNTSTGSSSNNQVKLPLIASGTYAFWVYWGDGNKDYITAHDSAAATHTYSVIGTYTITIVGIIKGFSFSNTGDKLKILKISYFGDLVISNAFAFQGCSNLEIAANDKLELNTTTLQAMFYFGSKVTKCPKMDTKNVANFNALFQYANITGPLAIDTQNATVLTTLLYNNKRFNSQINHLNTAKVVSMAYLLSADWDAEIMTFNQPLSGLNTSSVNNMQNMLYNCQSFNHSLADLDISKVTNMTDMLKNCYAWSTTNYSATLISWANQDVRDGVNFRCSSKYNASAVAARDHLTVNHGWVINDLGLE